MVKHLIFDLETLGKKSSSVILSLACVVFRFEDDEGFDDYIKSGFYVKFNPIEQLKSGRTTDKDTITWWKSQEPSARKITMPSDDDVSVKEGLTKLVEYIRKSGYDWKHSYCWSRGNYFDFPIIENVFEQYGIALPFNIWKIRDIRTMIDVMTGSGNGDYELKNGYPKNFIKHNCLHDAAIDIMKMKEIFKNILEG